MLARLLRFWVISLCALAAVWLAWGAWRGIAAPWLITGALAIVLTHAWLLALEFILLARVEPGGDLPRPGAMALLRAWWGEVWTGVRVFGWQQPFRSTLHADYLQPEHAGRRGVLLVHGFVCNRGLWNPWMAALRKRNVPFVAVNLEPVFGSIDSYAAVIEAAIRRLETATGVPPLLVGHSMGGLALRAWLRAQRQQHTADGTGRLHSIITIASPHHGTWLARFALVTNARQMRLASPWLASLAAGEDGALRSRFTCFHGHCDNIVVPASSGTLPGADNRHLPGVAHVHLVYQDAVWAEVMARLAATAQDN